MVDAVETPHRVGLTDQFEKFLADSLNTVEPDPKFVGHLHNRLVKKPEVEIEKRNFYAAYLIVGMGLFFGMFLFWILSQAYKGFRAILYRR